MMDNEREDKLLKQFFKENRQEIADNGFTHRVMRHLPDRYVRIARIWTILCAAIAFILFVAFDGLQLVFISLREVIMETYQDGLTDIDPKSMFIACIVLLYLLYRKIATLA